MRFWKVFLLLFAFLLFAPSFSQARDYAFPVAGAPFRAGARVMRGAAIVVTAPVRWMGRVVANGVERRQCRRVHRQAHRGC